MANLEYLLIEHCERAIKNDPTGQKRAMLIAELNGSMNSYVQAAHRLEGQVKSLLASAREIDVFLKLLEKSKGEKDEVPG